VLRQGTWGLGENYAKQDEDIAALRQGLDFGMMLIDTAEMYGEGAAEKLIGDVFPAAGKTGFRLWLIPQSNIPQVSK
jgi:aryl-alcohol dehydrogenase-like predicted oxidoreductase